MGCVETKELEETISKIYLNTKFKFFSRRSGQQDKEIRLILDLKKACSCTLFTKTNDLKPFGKNLRANQSKSYLKVDKSFLVVEDSWISSMCKNSFSEKVSS
jgi:hypothetical protein